MIAETYTILLQRSSIANSTKEWRAKETVSVTETPRGHSIHFLSQHCIFYDIHSTFSGTPIQLEHSPSIHQSTSKRRLKTRRAVSPVSQTASHLWI